MVATNGQSLVAEADPIQEPSMEDILASIRRIIASDQHIAGARALGTPLKTGAPSAVTSSSVATLSAVPTPASASSTVDVAPEPDQAPAYPGDIPNLDDLDPLVLPPAAVEPKAEPAAAARRDTPAVLHPELFPSAEVRSAAEAPVAVYDLLPSDRVGSARDAEDLISANAGDQVSSSFHMLADTILRDPETIERVARETLRPMLKTWLDENLPSMVERLVRAEIERVARGGRRG